ncbi:MAG: hypothetical protein ACO1SV_04915 [Fimbriimonas sp.]
MVWYVLSGLGILILGLFSEFGTRPRPVVPASFVPGFLFLCVGAAFVMAIVDRYRPKLGSLLYFVPALIIFYFQAVGRNSALPILLYAGIFQLLRAALRVVPFEE